MKLATLALVLLAPLVLAACTRPDAPRAQVHETDTRIESAPSPDRGIVSGMDRDLTANVRHAVDGDAQLASIAAQVTVLTVGGVVTLRGSVTSIEERDAIEAHARKVPGVRNVSNELEVLGELPAPSSEGRE